VSINEIFEWVNFISDKKGSGSISPDEFNLACNVVSRELFNVKAGLPEEYQVGAPYARQQYQVSQKITDDIRNFVKDTTISKANGYFAYPADYAAFSSLRYSYTLNSPDCGGDPISTKRLVEVVTDAEKSIREEDGILYPTLEYPIAVYKEPGIQVLPKEITQVLLTYLRFPVVPVFGYTVSQDEYVYNPTTSTQVDFPATLHPEFAVRICKYLAINIREDELYAMVEQRLAKGQ
jgi:hypothetical protein